MRAGRQWRRFERWLEVATPLFRMSKNAQTPSTEIPGILRIRNRSRFSEQYFIVCRMKQTMAERMVKHTPSSARILTSCVFLATSDSWRLAVAGFQV
jgi:hypothetical protein